MSDEKIYALLDGDGYVVNLIVADEDFISSLPALVADESVDTGDLPREAYRVDNIPDEVVRGWRRANNGRWVAPERPAPVEVVEPPETVALREDQEFAVNMKDKARGGEPLTQDERDRLLAIQLSQSLAPTAP